MQTNYLSDHTATVEHHPYRASGLVLWPAAAKAQVLLWQILYRFNFQRWPLWRAESQFSGFGEAFLNNSQRVIAACR